MTTQERSLPMSRAPGFLREMRPWRELGVLGTMLMGLSWGVPWFRSLTQATYSLSTGYTFLVLGGMMLAAYLLVRLMNAVRLRTDLRRGALLMLLAASVLIGLKTLLFRGEAVTIADLTGRQLESFADAYALIPDEFIITVAVLLVWRRGTQLASEKIGPQLIQGAFGLGILMFFFYIFFNTFATGETPGNMPVLFLFAGLMAMGSARVAVISSLRGGRDNPFDRRWMSGLLLSVAGVVGIAAWFGAEVAGGEGWIGGLPRLALGVVMALAFLVLTPFFALLYAGLFATLQVMQADNPVNARLTAMIGQLRGAAEELFAFLDPFLGPLGDLLASFGLVMKTLILWAVVLALVLAVLLAAYIQDRRRRELLREQLEHIRERGLWKTLKDSLLDGMRQAGQGLANLFDFDRRRRLLAAARVRRIYADLMDLCIELGAPRPEACTPAEFLPTLDGLFAGLEPDARTITMAYQQVRYGELPEDLDESAGLEAAWERIRQMGEEQKKRPLRTT